MSKKINWKKACAETQESLDDCDKQFRAERAAHEATKADRDYWFGVTDMRERLLAEQRDKLERLAYLVECDLLCVNRFDCTLGEKCPQVVVGKILGVYSW